MLSHGVTNSFVSIRKTVINELQKFSKKAYSQQKSSCDILESMLDMDVIFGGGGVEIHPISYLAYFEGIARSLQLRLFSLRYFIGNSFSGL